MLHFQELIENPTTVRQKEEGDIPGPRDKLEGKNCLASSSLVMTLPWIGCIPEVPDTKARAKRSQHSKKPLHHN